MLLELDLQKVILKAMLMNLKQMFIISLLILKINF